MLLCALQSIAAMPIADPQNNYLEKTGAAAIQVIVEMERGWASTFTQAWLLRILFRDT